MMLERARHSLRGANLLICGESLDRFRAQLIGSYRGCPLALRCLKLGVARRSRRTRQTLPPCRNEFVGARVGIMDQFISCWWARGTRWDARLPVAGLSPAADSHRVSLVSATPWVKHDLASGEYNTRRAECEEECEHCPGGCLTCVPCATCVSGPGSLPQRSAPDHLQAVPVMSYPEMRECVMQTAALERADLATFGRLMAESHISLKNDTRLAVQSWISWLNSRAS